MPVLLVERGGDKGTSLKVEAGNSYVVGRENPQAAVRLNDPMASRAPVTHSRSAGSWT